MPIYEFKCKKCGEEFSYLFMFNVDLAECPKCHTVHDKEDRHEISVSNFKIDMSNVSPL